MDDKALYILAGYDDETEKYLAGIQDKLYEQGFSGVHTKNIPQHITMGSFPVDKEGELKALLERIAASTGPFDVSFSHMGIFGGSRVLFIAPDADSHLIKLKETIGPAFGWAPHTTMLIDEPEVIYKALPIVADNFTSFTGKLTSLHLYEFWPTRHIMTVYLGS